MALYTSRGERMLIGDTFAGIAGAALAAIVLWWTAPVYVVVGLLILGPILAWLAIGVADLVRRSLSGRHLPG